MKPKEILTTADVAGICRCSHDTVKRWLETEQLRGHRLTPHGQWRILPQDLLEFMERQGLPLDDEGRGTLGLPESPVKEFVFCWEFHRRNKSHPAGGGRECKDCLVFSTKAKECFILRKEAGPDQVCCQGPCEECEYYHYTMEMENLAGGEDVPTA